MVRALVMGAGSGTATRSVVVAAEPVAFGAALTSANLREIPWSASEPLDGAFESVAELVRDGRRLALVKLARNEPILATKITAPNQRATLSTQIDEGMRAVTIRVDEVRGVAGFVLPGDRVDIILTRGEEGGSAGTAYADILLQNANVLAIDQSASERGDKPSVARAVTLELPVRDAQKVILAQGVGRLSLVLRQTGQADAAAAPRVTAGELGLGETAPRDRLAEVEKRIEMLSGAVETAGSKADAASAARMAELDRRLAEMNRQSLGVQAMQPAAPRPAASTGRVVSVTRNGTKTEQYTVAAER